MTGHYRVFVLLVAGLLEACGQDPGLELDSGRPAGGDGSNAAGGHRAAVTDPRATGAQWNLAETGGKGGEGTSASGGFGLETPQAGSAAIAPGSAGKAGAGGIGGDPPGAWAGEHSEGGVAGILAVEGGSAGAEPGAAGQGGASPTGGGAAGAAGIGGSAGASELPTCNDALLNGDESDVDCGGAVCSPCADGGGCRVGEDCESGLCDEGICYLAGMAPCFDGELDGDETDVDCGGPLCPPCAEGAICVGPNDCVTGECSCPTGECPPFVCTVPECQDGIRNGEESDVDCGGSSCPPCALGQSCTQNAECVNLSCVGTVCQAASCTNAVVDGSETDLGCGGEACPSCADGQVCEVSADCASRVCSEESTCAAATCTDGVLNGTETDVDCGGSCLACQ